MTDEGDGVTNCSWCTWNGPQKLGKETEKLEIRGINYTMVEIAQNTKKYPGDQRRLAVTQTPVKQTILWINSQGLWSRYLTSLRVFFSSALVDSRSEEFE